MPLRRSDRDRLYCTDTFDELLTRELHLPLAVAQLSLRGLHVLLRRAVLLLQLLQTLQRVELLLRDDRRIGHAAVDHLHCSSNNVQFNTI